MAFEKCAAGASQDGKVSPEEAKAMMDEIGGYIPRARAKLGGGASEADVLQEAAKMAHDAAKGAAYIERRNALMNLNKRKARFEYQKSFKPKDMYKSIASQIRGTNTPGDMRLMSAQGVGRVKLGQYVAAMATELERAGLVRFLNNERNELALAQELRELNQPPEARKPGASGNDAAVKAAKIIHGYLSLAKDELNAEGAWIGDLDGYIAHQAHDPAQMMRGGRSAAKPLESDAARQRWIDFVKPMLDERTFAGAGNKDKFLQGVYNSLVSGIHQTAEGSMGFKQPAFSGPGNKAKKLSSARVLHFKDAASDIAYQAEYGTKRLNDRIFKTLQASARNYALLKTWGTNPRAEFENDIQRLAEHYHDKDPAAVNAFQKKVDALRSRMDFLDGTANRPGNELGAAIMQNVRSVEFMSKLGNVMFTHLSVGATKAAELRHHGVGFFDRYSNFVSSFTAHMTPEERIAFGRDLLAEIDGAHGAIMSRFDPVDDFPGTASSIQNAYYRMTGLNWLYGIQRQGLLFKLSSNLAENAGKEFGELHSLLQNKLRGYGINEGEWNLLRKTELQKSTHGTKYLTPKATEKIPEADLREHGGIIGNDATAKAQTEALRNDLALKLHTYFSDSADRGMVTPGVEERALLLRGTKRGTIPGEIARSFAQFKMWPTAFITQVIARDLMASPNLKSAMGGILGMSVASTVYGYARMMAVDLISGKNPRSLSDWRTYPAAWLQGGGGGILGDFLFGQSSRFGTDPMIAMAGPAVSDADQLIKIWNDAKDEAANGTKHPLGSEMARFAISNMPFANLWFARTALNYALFWQMYETMSPGWAQRYEDKIKKENGQTMWLRPSQAVR